MKETIIKQLAELERMSTEQLKERWRVLFGTQSPGYNRVMIVKRLAYRIQELALGGLPGEVRARMDTLLEKEGFDELGRPAPRKSTKPDFIRPVPGTKLMREWNGERHEVLVTKTGFTYLDKPYKSLSSIARAITGTRWNGPAFFGLRNVGGRNVDLRSGDDA